MAFSISKGRISPIAIDFGADALKLLQVIPSDPPRLVAAATVELPEHARKGPAERRAFYTESLKVLLKSQPFRGRKAICSIPSYQTLVQHFQIPRYENDKTVEQVGVQLRERLNVDPNRMVMRIHSVGSVARDTSKKGTGFTQPLKAHDHWHVDISYVNVAGTFYFLCSVLDGFSRSIVHWDLRESIKEVDVEIVLQAAREKYPEVSPRIITDNGPQFIARDFKEFIRISGMTHVRTSPESIPLLVEKLRLPIMVKRPVSGF